MKKLLLLSVTLLVSILLLVGFSLKKKHPQLSAASTAINCIVPANITAITDAEFKARYNPNVVMVRKNVYSLTAAEITSIKTGVTAMKALPYTNKTSWLYQAAIHGTTLPDNLPSWNTCHQAGASFFFLAWHRMYVYFFERILRAKSGNANLTLPYLIATNPAFVNVLDLYSITAPGARQIIEVDIRSHVNKIFLQKQPTQSIYVSLVFNGNRLADGSKSKKAGELRLSGIRMVQTKK